MADLPPPRRKRRFDEERGVFMISVAAELAEMHPQTLRMYEAARADRAEALAEEHAPLLPARRRAAAADPGDDREGLNLVGVETVLALEERVAKLSARAGAGPPADRRTGTGRRKGGGS